MVVTYFLKIVGALWLAQSDWILRRWIGRVAAIELLPFSIRCCEGVPMSWRASAKLFFGVCYESSSKDSEHIRSDDSDSSDSPGELWASMEPVGGIRIVDYGHNAKPSFGLAIAESVVVGKDWMPLSLHESQQLVQFGWIDRIITYANKHGLTIDAETRFGYWIVPYYG
jgi:hypothetical protein